MHRGDDTRQRAGCIALVGSGEYLDVMIEPDRYLLESVGGPTQAQVVVLATAAGREDPSSPQRWQTMGMQHFQHLGAQVERVDILNRHDAQDPRWLTSLAQASLIYFSGGNPQHLIASLKETPAWDTIRRRHQEGAVLAGCSAGAMAFGGHILTLRSLREGGLPYWEPALGLLPTIVTIPHFDRWGHFMPTLALDGLLATAPPDTILLGIDEDTALIRLPRTEESTSSQLWQVMGRQTVTVFHHEQHHGSRTILHAGQVVDLEAVTQR